MAVAIITASYTTTRTQKDLKADHLWYDQEAGWLVKINAGRLMFSYTGGKTKMSVAELKGTSYVAGNNYQSIMDWIKVNKSDFGLEVVDGGSGVVAVSFPDAVLEEVDDALYFNRFEYEII